MISTQDAWKEHLVMVGEDAYFAAFPNKGIDTDCFPLHSGENVNPNREEILAMLHAVAAMISENDAAHRRSTDAPDQGH